MTLSPSSQKVQEALTKLGISAKIIELPQTTRTAAEAAAALKCDVSQIAKSIVFEGESGKGILVIASGKNRINEEIISAIVGEQIKKASAEFVRNKTGFVIGGVPPLGHLNPMKVLIDEDLLKYDKVWTAGGTPNAVFSISMRDLLTAISAIIARIGQN